MNRMQRISLYLAALLFLAAGLLHLVRPGPFMAIVPPYVPHHRTVVLISGLAEIFGAFGLLVPFARKPAAWGLVLLLVAVFPANIHMALHHIQVTARPLPNYALWGRLFLQPLMIWWVWSLARIKN